MKFITMVFIAFISISAQATTCSCEIVLVTNILGEEVRHSHEVSTSCPLSSSYTELACESSYEGYKATAYCYNYLSGDEYSQDIYIGADAFTLDYIYCQKL